LIVGAEVTVFYASNLMTPFSLKISKIGHHWQTPICLADAPFVLLLAPACSGHDQERPPLTELWTAASFIQKSQFRHTSKRGVS